MEFCPLSIALFRYNMMKKCKKKIENCERSACTFNTETLEGSENGRIWNMQINVKKTAFLSILPHSYGSKPNFMTNTSKKLQKTFLHPKCPCNCLYSIHVFLLPIMPPFLEQFQDISHETTNNSEGAFASKGPRDSTTCFHCDDRLVDKVLGRSCSIYQAVCNASSRGIGCLLCLLNSERNSLHSKIAIIKHPSKYGWTSTA